jgi:hypothetical protein
VQLERSEDARMPAFGAVINAARLGERQNVTTAEIQTFGHTSGGRIPANAGNERRELLAQNVDAGAALVAPAPTLSDRRPMLLFTHDGLGTEWAQDTLELPMRMRGLEPPRGSPAGGDPSF